MERVVESSEVERAISLLRILWEIDSGMHRVSRSMRARIQVSGRERLVLKLLACYPAIGTPGLARFVGVPVATMSRQIRRLQRRNLVERANGLARGVELWRLTA